MLHYHHFYEPLFVIITYSIPTDVLVVKRLSLLELDLATRVQIRDEAVYISQSANTLGKGMHPTILPVV